MDDGGTFEIRDADGETRNALVRYDKETRHVLVSVDDYFSGTSMRGGAADLVNKLFKRCKSAELILRGSGSIKLPVKYEAV